MSKSLKHLEQAAYRACSLKLIGQFHKFKEK